MTIFNFIENNSKGLLEDEPEQKKDNTICKLLVFLSVLSIKIIVMIVYCCVFLAIFEYPYNIRIFIMDFDLVWGWIAIFFGFLHLPSITIYCIGYISVSNTNKTILEQLRDGSVLFLVLLLIIIILIILPYTFYSDGINQQKNKKEFLVIKEIDNTPISKQIVLYEGKDFYIISQYRLFNGNQDKIIVNNKTSSYISKENVTTKKIWFDSVYTEKSFRDEQIEKEKKRE